jgi:hypothetical protein
MKTYLRVLGGLVCIGLLLLFSISRSASASPSRKVTVLPHGPLLQGHLLPHSPLSAGLLMALAQQKGLVRLSTSNSKAPAMVPTSPSKLNCTPAPCVLPDVQASGGNGKSKPVNDTAIAADPADGLHILPGATDYNCKTTLAGFYPSSNGGSTWKHTCMNFLFEAGGAGDPSVGYDLNGNAYITEIATGTIPDGFDIVFEKSQYNGAKWSTPKIAVHNAFPGGLTDKDWLAIDDSSSSSYANALYISDTQFDVSQNSEINVTHSDNGGKTWKTVNVDPLQMYPTIDQYSDLAIGRDGTVYATWLRCTANGPTNDCGGTQAGFYISKSSDGGNTWTTPSQFATVNLAPDTCNGCAFYGTLPNTQVPVSEIPVIATDNSGGTYANSLYVTYYNWTGSYMQVEDSTSTDGGNTWSTPQAVAPGITTDQFLPWISVSPTGTVGVSWLDRRNDPKNISYEAFAAISNSGGAKFSNDIQIASQLSNPNNDGFGGTFLGDYTGNIWAGGKLLYVSWPDTRNGKMSQDYVGGYLN